VLDIKSRLALAERRAAHVRGVDAAFAHIFEDKRAFLRAAGAYVGMAALLVGLSSLEFLSGAFSRRDHLSAKELVSMAAYQGIGPWFTLGIALSIATALARGRAYYRSRLRPLLLAESPKAPGLPFRCRVCGGDLPRGRTADVRCMYCSTVNLIPKELHREHTETLSREAEALRRKLAKTTVETMSIASAMKRTFLACLGAVALLALGVPWLLRSLIHV
jgi:hypothetical protein